MVEVLRQKEAELARVRRQIESLKIVAPLLSEEVAFEDLTKKPPSVSRGNTGQPPEPCANQSTLHLYDSM
jgi:hypothetical protein